MNAPITVKVPWRHNALQTLEMLIAAGIPATPKITKGKVRIDAVSGTLAVVNKKTWVRGEPLTFQWTPPAYEPRPLFQANDAERFVILASLMNAIYEHQGEVVDPLHAVMRRIIFEEPPTAPAADYWRKLIDRAVMEAGGAR